METITQLLDTLTGFILQASTYSNLSLLVSGTFATLAAGGIAARLRGNVLATLGTWLLWSVILYLPAWLIVQALWGRVVSGDWWIVAVVIGAVLFGVLTTRATEKTK